MHSKTQAPRPTALATPLPQRPAPEPFRFTDWAAI
jgi:hypothetical protein